MSRLGGVTFVLAAVLAACSGGERVIVAAGTTLVDSGVVDELVDRYETGNPGVEVSVVGRSTREVLDLGGRGAADLLVTHAPRQEAAFLQAHPEARNVPLFSSRFLLVGPEDRAQALSGFTVVAAFQQIADRGWAFVTRADGSGTNERERELWEAADITPDGLPWFLETGQGMGLSLQVADQRGAFILVEEGTYLASSAALRLVTVDVEEVADLLVNRYTAIVPVGDDNAIDFLGWLVSAEGRAALRNANTVIFDAQIFIPGNG